MAEGHFFLDTGFLKNRSVAIPVPIFRCTEHEKLQERPATFALFPKSQSFIKRERLWHYEVLFATVGAMGKSFLTDVELFHLLGHAVRRAAQLLGIKDYDWLSIDRLLELIEQVDEGAYNRLEEYRLAYREWVAFHRNIEEAGKQGNLDADETAKLAQLTKTRDAACKELAEYFAKK